MMNAVLTTVMLYCLIPSAVGVTLYAIYYPDWKRSPQGRNFFLLTASIGLIALTVLVLQVFEFWRFYQYILAVLFFVVGTLLWQRLMLIREQIHRDHARRANEHAR